MRPSLMPFLVTRLIHSLLDFKPPSIFQEHTHGQGFRVTAAQYMACRFPCGCQSAGMTFSDVQSLLGILSFLVFLGVFCWSHGEPSLKRVWAVLAGGGAIMTLLGWLLLPG